MKKLYFILFIVILQSCGTVEIPKDKEKEAPELDEKVIHYLKASKEGSSYFDEYGLLLPKHKGEHKDQGDALIWNSVTLASLCLLRSNQATYLWSSIKNNLQSNDGRLFRHPTLSEGAGRTSISKDGVIGFLFLGAIAKHTDCEPVVNEYGESLEKFRDYLLDHDYEMGVGKTDLSVTYLSDRHVLRMVLKLYDIDHTELDYKTSIHDLYLPARNAEMLFDLDHGCKRGDQNACNILGSAGVYMNHLTYLSLVIAYIDSIHNPNSQYSEGEVAEYIRLLALSGVDKKVYNWLFISQWRKTKRNQTYNDALKFLKQNFPDDFPSESNPVVGWGCSDYIWQRSPYERCSKSGTSYLGTDFLLLYGIIKGF